MDGLETDTEMLRLLRQLQSHIVWQNERIYALELLIGEIREDLKMWRQTASTHIDKIDYTFDQLKVERLEGTLQIGVSPEGVSRLEELAVGGKPEVQTAASPAGGDTLSSPERDNPLFKRMEQYIRFHVPMELLRLERQYGLALDDATRNAVLDDLVRQMGDRLRVHLELESAAQPDGALPPTAEARIVERLQSEILAGLEQFAKNRQKQKEEPP